MDEDDDELEPREALRRQFERELEAKLARRARAKSHRLLPDFFLGWASEETWHLFVDGRYYGCITLIQALAEGLAKFLAEKNGLPRELYADEGWVKPQRRIDALHEGGLISAAGKEAFERIAGNDRNDFHHMNRQVPADLKQLKARAEECLLALHAIEGEVFAYRMEPNGAVVPIQKQYWRITANGDLHVFIKNTPEDAGKSG
ncbi:MAG: hypothetical protein HS116_20350 [Planctomycetes bacterium]|nr:hypothetical protein [Planctomycetota bacterium]